MSTIIPQTIHIEGHTLRTDRIESLHFHLDKNPLVEIKVNILMFGDSVFAFWMPTKDALELRDLLFGNPAWKFPKSSPKPGEERVEG